MGIEIYYLMKHKLPFFNCAAIAALIGSASATVTMDWVSIGDINNAPDTADGNNYFSGIQRFGAVDHAYQIGKYEVTNAQYGEFLNAKGQTNSSGIYNSYMLGYGITQSGNSGSYSYTVNAALANHPVVNVSWFDAARFANWMMNGQGSNDMEDGAYTLNGATSGIFLANTRAQIYIPSENEWYKAAYYNATNTSYSLYPNGKNTISGDDANFYSSAFVPVGSYISASSSYGTFDQGGNAWEWHDGVFYSEYRGVRGGAFASAIFDMSSSINLLSDPTFEGFAGFRLASVPEPTSMVLTMFAGGMMLIRRKR